MMGRRYFTWWYFTGRKVSLLSSRVSVKVIKHLYNITIKDAKGQIITLTDKHQINRGGEVTLKGY